MGHIKRSQAALATREGRKLVEDISKARWVEMYVDLLRAVRGEDFTEKEILTDIVERNGILDYQYGTGKAK